MPTYAVIDRSGAVVGDPQRTATAAIIAWGRRAKPPLADHARRLMPADSASRELRSACITGWREALAAHPRLQLVRITEP